MEINGSEFFADPLSTETRPCCGLLDILGPLRLRSRFSYDIPNPNHARQNDTSINATQVKPFAFL